MSDLVQRIDGFTSTEGHWLQFVHVVLIVGRP